MPGPPGRDQVAVLVHAAQVAGEAEVERGGHQRVGGIVVRHVRHPGGQVPELGRAVDPAALRLGDLAQQRDHAGNPGAGGGSQLRGARLLAGVGRKPGADRQPAAPPVLEDLIAPHQRALVGVSDPVQQRSGSGRLDLRDSQGQARQVPVELRHEIAHVRHQRVLVAQEHLRRGVRRAGDVTERQVKAGRPARHVLHDPVEAGQAAHDLLAVAVAIRLRQAQQVAQDVGEHQPGQVRVLHPRGEHALDGRVRAVPQFAELVHRLPVPVSGQTPGP